MGKVTFEFDEEENLDDINFIVNRKRIIAALDEICNYQRRLDKGYVNAIMIKGDTILGRNNNTVSVDDALGSEYYIKDEDVYDEIDKILNKISDLLY